MKRVFLLIAAMILTVAMLALNVGAYSYEIDFDDESLGSEDAVGIAGTTEPVCVPDGNGGFYLNWHKGEASTEGTDGMLRFGEDPRNYFGDKFIIETKVMVGLIEGAPIPANKSAFEFQMKALEGWTGAYRVVALQGNGDKLVLTCPLSSGALQRIDVNYGDWHTISIAYDWEANLINVFFDGENVGHMNIGKPGVSGFAYFFCGMADKMLYAYDLNFDDFRMYSGETPADWVEPEEETTPEATTPAAENTTVADGTTAGDVTAAGGDETDKPADETAGLPVPAIIGIAVAAVAVIAAVVVVIVKKKK